MKTLLLFVLSIVLLFMGCGLTPTATLLTGQNTAFDEQSLEYVGRIGAIAGRTEFGFTNRHLTRVDDNVHMYGGYILQELIDDPNMFLLNGAYIGAQVTTDFDSKAYSYGPIVGTVFNIGGVEILTEVQYRTYGDALEYLQQNNNDRYLVLIGPRFKFR